MPWGLLIRLASLVLAAVGLSRMRRQAAPPPPPDLPRRRPSALRRRVDDAREGVSLLTRTVAIAVAMVFALLATTAGLTLIAPGPFWLALVFLGAAAMAWITSIIEMLRVRRLVGDRRDRRRMQASVHVVDTSDETPVGGAGPR